MKSLTQLLEEQEQNLIKYGALIKIHPDRLKQIEQWRKECIEDDMTFLDWLEKNSE